MTQAEPAISPQAVYENDAEVFHPTDLAASPWAEGVQHGGPPTGLLARAIEKRYCTKEIQPTRLSVDLFRAVPMKPCKVELRSLRSGRRINVIEATLLSESTVVARATALLLKRSPHVRIEPVARDQAPVGPEGLETSGLIPREVLSQIPPGFHSHVEVRWATPVHVDRPAAWLRLPTPLVAGEETTPFQRAAALSDLGNALAQVARRSGRGQVPSFINADNSLYLTRPPVGEWLCLQVHLIEENDGIGLAASVMYDTDGRVGRTLSSRLANDRTTHEA